MNNSYIDQITLDCLINKEIIGKHIIKQREKQINKDEFNFYRKRILNLFKTIISCKLPIDLSPEIDLSPDVKYAYDNFIKSTINYFKITDNNDLLQEEYKDINNSLDNNFNNDLSSNLLNNDTDLLLTRSIKIDVYNLDKYVKRTSTKKKRTHYFT